MEILALITARGGSKSIPGKNISILAGKPSIAWTIEAALKSPLISRIVVSTDDEEIARVSSSWGADIPLMRPPELAKDDSPHIDVMIHAVEWLAEHEDYYPDSVMLLQPTSPLRTSEDIERAIELFLVKNADSVVSVNLTENHPYLAKCINDHGYLDDFIPKPDGYLPRQKFPPVYSLNGAIYLVKREILLDQKELFPRKTCAYVMPVERSLDIDTTWDLYLANLILQDRENFTSNKEAESVGNA